MDFPKNARRARRGPQGVYIILHPKRRLRLGIQEPSYTLGVWSCPVDPRARFVAVWPGRLQTSRFGGTEISAPRASPAGPRMDRRRIGPGKFAPDACACTWTAGSPGATIYPRRLRRNSRRARAPGRARLRARAHARGRATRARVTRTRDARPCARARACTRTRTRVARSVHACARAHTRGQTSVRVCVSRVCTARVCGSRRITFQRRDTSVESREREGRG